ncbi:hypothetical protein K461DRAFT_24629 [Myriangium duriaei CBS 260.36]|uniref:Uncharacterized protein n=1 Tax=Myriangium duriaei CBS 260.36 TaxID=1168546 RepID=A0A9P4JA60_9PEZI|nr:hypothetical protein K461DRAFT_24629 [Myriangium duriaei CBS 260.36]
MLNVKVLLLGLLFAYVAIAAKITYTGRYRIGNGEIKKVRSSGTIADNKVQLVLGNIRRYSEERFRANQGANGIITVYNDEIANSKHEAGQIVTDMKDCVQLIIE